MSPMNKRTLLGLTAAATLAALVGCGKKEEAPAPAAAAPSAPASVAAAPAPEPLKVAWVYIGPVGDAGWTFAHDQGRKAAEAEFGDKIKTTFVEKVPESADAERVLRDLASQGHKLIFTTSFGYMEPTIKVASEFPDVKFMHATGYKLAPNVGVYDASFYQDAYISGMIAGAMTKTNTLGFVGSFPIPEVLRNINAYTLGAQATNPKAKVKVVWVNTWFDPPKESEAAQSLINAGADVLLQNTDSSAVLQTAEKAGKFAFGWDSDMQSYAPNAHLASAVINWGPYYIQEVQKMLDGKWETGESWWGVKEGAIDLVSISDKVPAELKGKAEAAKAGLKDGSLVIWKGPIVDQAGKEVLKKDEVADDTFLRGIKFFVKGVDAKMPGEK